MTALEHVLAQVDGLFQHPAIAHATSVVIRRRFKTDHAGALREGAADLALTVVGLGSDGAPGDNQYLCSTVMLRAARGPGVEPVTLAQVIYDNPGRGGYGSEQRLIERCLGGCLPRGLALELELERDLFGRVLDAPKHSTLERWDPRYPLCIPSEQLGARRHAAILTERGWSVELDARGLRLSYAPTPNQIVNAAREAFSRVAQLLGDEARERPGPQIVIEAGVQGVLCTTRADDGKRSTEHWPRVELWALGIVERGSQTHPISFYTARDAEQLYPLGIRDDLPALRALELALASAMLGVE